MSPNVWRRIAAVVLLLVLFALLVFSVQMKSPTADEQNHIARGLACLKTGDLRLSQEHPPGANAWEAWPLLLDPTVRLPLDSPSWENGEWYGFADQLLWQVNDHPQAMVFATRVPVMWLTVILAALVHRWARALGGERAGLFAVAMLALDPNLLAHGRLTTTDMAVTCLSFAAIWCLWRALRKPVWGRWVCAGAVLGLAQLAKFSALVLVPSVTLVLFVAAAYQAVARGSGRRGVGQWALRLLLLLVTCGLVVWAGYRFTWGSVSPLGGLPGPAPAYWAGIEAILQRTGGGSTAFLAGEVSETGWWYYFPVAFVLKTPLPTLILLVLALGLWIWQRVTGKPIRDRSSLPLLACLFLPALAFWGMALLGGFNIGYRHVLPSLPFLYTWAGVWLAGTRHSGESGNRDPRGVRSAISPGLFLVVALLIWLAVATLVVAPDYLAFFNVFAGGPAGGYRYLVDSNLDWGQDLPGLARYVREQGSERVHLSWFGAAHPEAYGFDFVPLPGFWRFRGDPATYGLNPLSPEPGLYAISATNLQAIKLDDRDTYAWFRARKPEDTVGHSILIYRVDRPAPDRAVVLAVPAVALAEQERGILASGASVRQYDPATGIILPLSIDPERAWYVASEAPHEASIVRTTDRYQVFQLPPKPSLAPPMARFGSYVQLVRLEIEDQVADPGWLWVTAEWWVEAPPYRAAVSFVHLLDQGGYYLAGWDGLTAPATCWHPGDLIRQDYRFALPDGLASGRYSLEVGWYDASTVTRWLCTVDGEPVGDRFLVADVEVAP